ncbi:MAG: enoyl-CoA hydratase/isomerase family protein [Promethearchaeota archaeon]
MPQYEIVELEIDESEGYAILYLNRPLQLNALSYKLAEEMSLALYEISKNNRIRCLILTGKGKAFCSGGDIAEFKRAEDPVEFMFKLVSKLHEGIKILTNLKSSSIAAVNGACFGAGLGFACACDLRICSENATFGSAFTRLGLSPDSSTTYFLPKIIGLSLANDMILLNRVLNAEEALRFNLVSKVISSSLSFLQEIKEIAIKISNGPALAFESSKRLLMRSFTNDLEKHLEIELKNIKINAATEDFQEGIRAFLEKRQPNFQGS